MTRHTTIERSFDVRVKDPSDNWLQQTFDEVVKVFREKTVHYFARDAKCALRKAKQDGYIVLSVGKTKYMEEVALSRITLDLINHNLPRPSALALDEVALRKRKREERLNNHKKYDKSIDSDG
jgi:hypothetical protein